ncbi:MAG TPA: RNA methyltransferase [Anaerolineae bacterium]|nr:RNA methyltransferase [Anaerolineae bacterium]
MITSTANRRVKWVRALQTKRHARQEEGVFVIEGVRLAREAVASQSPVKLVLHTDNLGARERGLVNNLARLGAEIEVVSESVMVACSSTESPPGLLVVLPTPTIPSPEPLSFALVVDRLADPGNLGTILRTALAAGVEVLFLTKGTVDPFNPKVVRSATGAHFRLPIEILEPRALAQRLDGMQIWIAEAGHGVLYHEVNWRQSIALIIGCEAHGPQPAIRSLAKGQVQIPMRVSSDSLNAAIAAAVILFEIARQRGEP